jgi:hypothetical protein
MLVSGLSGYKVRSKASGVGTSGTDLVNACSENHILKVFRAMQNDQSAMKEAKFLSQLTNNDMKNVNVIRYEECVETVPDLPDSPPHGAHSKRDAYASVVTRITRSLIHVSSRLLPKSTAFCAIEAREL